MLVVVAIWWLLWPLQCQCLSLVAVWILFFLATSCSSWGHKFKNIRKKRPSPSAFFQVKPKFKKSNKKTTSHLFVCFCYFEFPGWPFKGFARRKYGFRICGALHWKWHERKWKGHDKGNGTTWKATAIGKDYHPKAGTCYILAPSSLLITCLGSCGPRCLVSSNLDLNAFPV